MLLTLSGRAMSSRRLLPIAGKLTEVLTIPSRPGSMTLQALIIPGNPGAAAYYAPFMQALHTAYSGGIEVVAVSQLGHGHNHGSKVFSLKEQIAHKVAFMQEQLLLPGRPPLIVMGHSIGAYMAIKAVDQIESGVSMPDSPPIQKVIAICPFLTVDKDSQKQWYLRVLTVAPIAVGAACSVMGMLPDALQRRLILLYAGRIDEHAVRATQGLLNLSSGMNAAFLGQTEFTDLAEPADWALLRKLGKRCLVLCAPEDTWFPHWKWEQMWLEVPEIEAYWEHELMHAFCVSEKLSATLATRVRELL